MSTITFPLSISQVGLCNPTIHYQLNAEELTQQTLQRHEGMLSSAGALCVSTGSFTGRSPKDKFIVLDDETEDTIDWNTFNIPMEEKYFLKLKAEMVNFLNMQKELWLRDCYACADMNHRLNLRVLNDNPWSNLFALNMFIRPIQKKLDAFKPDWHIIHAPSFEANPSTDGTRRKNFAVISFAYRTILIGGTGYTGEIKKSIFTILNYILPRKENILSMHCSSNIGKGGDVAIFFGLSGTGKTTLSTDSERKLIGDDEHGWTDRGVFNFEGGCYAKCIDLSEEKEPEIFHAIKPGALVENVVFDNNTNCIDFSSKKITENTRVSYPLEFMFNAEFSGVAGHPKNVFFLTCDAFGVLPPISLLTPGQAMYHFLSGYTAKVAGTEEGIAEPKITFSACFGAPFMPLRPSIYAEMFGRKMQKHNVNVWMVNTGWIGGGYGTGARIKLKYTRLMIHAALNGKLKEANFKKHPVFNMMIPSNCPGVPKEILDPRNTWVDKQQYDQQSKMLAQLFIENFKAYESDVSNEILSVAPIYN